jgi:chromate transporter
MTLKIVRDASVISFTAALRFWLGLGFISFGGPAGQIALMHRALVDERRWISEGRFLHALNYCMVLPGPEAQQLATYLGWLMHGTLGGVVAGALFILPSLGILILLSWMYVTFGSLPLVDAIFEAIKPAVIAVVLQACHRLGTRTLKGPALWGLAALALFAAFMAVPFPLIILGAAAFGLVAARFTPSVLAFTPSHSRSARRGLPALIDDDTPTPAHARPRRGRLFAMLFCGLGLWVGGLVVLGMLFGYPHLLLTIAMFFTKAALLTFGGAYAVLPYVHDGAVNTYGWLTSSQMLDGLALGETTPGPLIMIVSFVGYLAGHASTFLGAEHNNLAGVLTALVATWFTFLPSFVFVLAGGPLVEASRNKAAYTAVLTAISAAVVSAILKLALVLAGHIIVPDWDLAAINIEALAITLASAVALLIYKRRVVEVLAAAAALGAAGQFL